MPQLQPLVVPWSISSSNPSLGFTTRSIDGVNHGFVAFLGFLGESTRLSTEFGRYRQIAAVFERVLFAKLFPETSTSDISRIDGYDWSLVPEFADEGNSLKGATRRFHDQWNATDLCPQPSAFTVRDSDLLNELRIPVDEFKHYLFVGEDFNVEVVAKSMTWQVVEAPAEVASMP